MTLLSAAILLFLVIDPFGNIPFFLVALKRADPARHRRIIVRELLIALLALLVFLFTGQYILRALQISNPALTVAGGILLFLIAIKMIFPRKGNLDEEDLGGEPLLVPLAIPYVAGPSAMAAVLFIMNREPHRWPEWLAAVILAWLASGLIILCSGGLRRFLGDRGLIALERLMGMVLIAMSVQMMMNGLTLFQQSKS